MQYISKVIFLADFFAYLHVSIRKQDKDNTVFETYFFNHSFR